MSAVSVVLRGRGLAAAAAGAVAFVSGCSGNGGGGAGPVAPSSVVPSSGEVPEAVEDVPPGEASTGALPGAGGGAAGLAALCPRLSAETVAALLGGPAAAGMEASAPAGGGRCVWPGRALEVFASRVGDPAVVAEEFQRQWRGAPLEAVAVGEAGLVGELRPGWWAAATAVAGIWVEVVGGVSRASVVDALGEMVVSMR